MTSGVPTALSGNTYHSIDGQPCVESTKFAFTHNPPLKQKYSFAGFIGTAKGQAGCGIDLVFANPAGKAQFNLLALAAQHKSGDLGFTYDFWEGDPGIGNHWLVTNCFLGNYKLTNDPETGDAERTCSILGAPPRLIS